MKKKVDKGLQPLFKFASVIHKYNLNRLFGHSNILIKFLGVIFGRRFISQLENAKYRMKSSLLLLWPHFSSKEIDKLYHSALHNAGSILCDMIFRLPNATPNNLYRYVKFNGLEILDEALSTEKGVILTSVHTSNLFYIILGLIFHPKKYHLAVVANLANKLLFEELLKKHHLDNLHVIGTNKFENIKQKFNEHLKLGHILLIMVDFSNKNQLWVPFYKERFPYYVPFPQSPIKLHRDHGSPIFIGKIMPDKTLGHAMIEIKPLPISNHLENSIKNLNQQSNMEKRKFQMKQYHGLLSSQISSSFAPFLRKYAHVWTELRQFSRKTEDYLLIPPQLSLIELIEHFENKINHYLNDYFLPGWSFDKYHRFLFLNSEFFKCIEEIAKYHSLEPSISSKIELHNFSIENRLKILYERMFDLLNLKEDEKGTIDILKIHQEILKELKF